MHREERQLAQSQIDAINAVIVGKAPLPPPPTPLGVRSMRHNPPPAPVDPLPKAALPAPAAPPAVVNAKAGTPAPLAVV